MLKISVVIPLYNKEKHVRRAIDSIGAQTVPDFEIIVVDDGSTDMSAEVVRKIEDKRIVLIQQDNHGVNEARNRGIEEVRVRPRASSGLIAFLDADDVWKPRHLETILRLRNKYPDAGAYATAYEIREARGKVAIPVFNAISSYPWEGILPNYFKSCLGASPVWTSAVAIPSKVFEAVGNFPNNDLMAGDLDMWLRVALRYPIAFSASISAVYHRDSMNRICLTEYSIGDYALVKSAREAIKNNKISSEDKVYLNEYIYMKEIERAGRCIVRGENKKARELLKESETRLFRRKKAILFLLTFFPTSMVRLFRALKREVLRDA